MMKVLFVFSSMQYIIEEEFKSAEEKGYTFLSWLMLCEQNKLDEARAEESRRNAIDEFVRENIRIRPNKSALKNTATLNQESDSEEPHRSGNRVSETLANIYIQQKKLQLAQAVYAQLSLENPEKKAYFADLIAKLKQEANQT